MLKLKFKGFSDIQPMYQNDKQIGQNSPLKLPESTQDTLKMASWTPTGTKAPKAAQKDSKRSLFVFLKFLFVQVPPDPTPGPPRSLQDLPSQTPLDVDFDSFFKNY